MPFTIAIKNALVRIQAASLRRQGLTMGRSGLYSGNGFKGSWKIAEARQQHLTISSQVDPIIIISGKVRVATMAPWESDSQRVIRMIKKTQHTKGQHRQAANRYTVSPHLTLLVSSSRLQVKQCITKFNLIISLIVKTRVKFLHHLINIITQKK